MTKLSKQFVTVVPAAGIGARMGAEIPKQYLPLLGKTVIEHTLSKLLTHPRIGQVVVALGPQDQWFDELSIARNENIIRVNGGKERADSVLAGLQACHDYEWVLVHDAARPCLTHADIDALITAALASEAGAILGSQVRDTMKRTDENGNIISTVDRAQLWHALTPQMFPLPLLFKALTVALDNGLAITDEASAIECQGLQPKMVVGRADNIKITRPEDMPLAALFLQQQKKSREHND